MRIQLGGRGASHLINHKRLAVLALVYVYRLSLKNYILYHSYSNVERINHQPLREMRLIYIYTCNRSPFLLEWSRFFLRTCYLSHDSLWLRRSSRSISVRKTGPSVIIYYYAMHYLYRYPLYSRFLLDRGDFDPNSTHVQKISRGNPENIKHLLTLFKDDHAKSQWAGVVEMMLRSRVHIMTYICQTEHVSFVSITSHHALSLTNLQQISFIDPSFVKYFQNRI